MSGNNKKLLVLFYNGMHDEKTVRVQARQLTTLLKSIDSPENFCTANEMVNRYHITCDPKKMLKEAKFIRLRSFRFFLNKN